jgi:hypothetical protein
MDHLHVLAEDVKTPAALLPPIFERLALPR